jgi:hypothetical protein
MYLVDLAAAATTTNLAARVLGYIWDHWRDDIKEWAVFLLCLAASGVGVIISFAVFGSTITGIKLWGLAVVIAIIMLGLNYATKWSNVQTRRRFTPVDFVLYVSQGFLWPAAWPALADKLHIDKLAPPAKQGAIQLVELIQQLTQGVVL